MQDLKELVSGYGRFHKSLNSEASQLYRDLAEKGQSPKTMVISCCDSRVDPSAIFDAGPGDLFVVRNVANLVPPFEPHGDYHGTSAALEFAVNGLKVENIVVMGHAKCGGISAFLSGVFGRERKPGFIESWMSLLNPVRAQVIKAGQELSEEERQKEMEFAGIRCSLENLQTFPFIKDAVSAGRLKLRGAYFSVFDGTLMGLDENGEEFKPVSIP